MARTRPHIKVHLSVIDHPKTSAVWSDLQKRGMLVELWRKAGEKYAAKRADWVPLRPTDRLDIAAESDLSRADVAVKTLCQQLGYAVKRYHNRWEVQVRKFAKKQGFEGEELQQKLSEPGQELPPPNPNPIQNPIPREEKISEAPSAPPAERAPRTRRTQQVAFPGSMQPEDWDDLAEKHQVCGDRLFELAKAWASEKDHRYAPRGWKQAIDRALRDRWWWTSSLFATSSGVIQNSRESAADARIRKTNDAARGAVEILMGQRSLTAIEGGVR